MRKLYHRRNGAPKRELVKGNIKRKRFSRYYSAHTLHNEAYELETTLHRAGDGTADDAAVSLLHAQGITNKDLLDGLANPSRWLTYSGDYTGRRFSPLTQITPANAGRLAAQWTFQNGVVNKFEATPIVIDGVMYMTGALNHAWAVDARTGTPNLALPASASSGTESVLRDGESGICRLR